MDLGIEGGWMGSLGHDLKTAPVRPLQNRLFVTGAKGGAPLRMHVMVLNWR